MKTWEEMAEVQPLASQIITNSFKKNRVSHAYLIQGNRGTGKRSLALLIAKGLFCMNKDGINPCHTCNVCQRISSKNFPDVHWIEPDGASIKIDQIEKLQREFTYSGLESTQKVYIVSGSETLTPNAANRILKFLEEPNRRTTAILLTENSESIIPTIRSRCQMIDLRPLHPKAFQEELMASGLSETHARLMSALTSNLDEAIEWIEDAWFVQARKIVLQLIDRYLANPEDGFLFIHQYWLPHFTDRKQHDMGLDLLLLGFKDFLYFHLNKKDALVMFSLQDDRLEKAMLQYTQEKLIMILEAVLTAKQKLRQNVHPTLVMEQLTLHIQR